MCFQKRAVSVNNPWRGRCSDPVFSWVGAAGRILTLLLWDRKEKSGQCVAWGRWCEATVWTRHSAAEAWLVCHTWGSCQQTAAISPCAGWWQAARRLWVSRLPGRWNQCAASLFFTLDANEAISGKQPHFLHFVHETGLSFSSLLDFLVKPAFIFLYWEKGKLYSSHSGEMYINKAAKSWTIPLQWWKIENYIGMKKNLLYKKSLLTCTELPNINISTFYTISCVNIVFLFYTQRHFR